MKKNFFLIFFLFVSFLSGYSQQRLYYYKLVFRNNQVSTELTKAWIYRLLDPDYVSVKIDDNSVFFIESSTELLDRVVDSKMLKVGLSLTEFSVLKEAVFLEKVTPEQKTKLKLAYAKIMEEFDTKN